LPPIEGRRRTLANAESIDWEVVDPPQNVAQAVARAEEAGQRALEVDGYRRSLPRKRRSPKKASAEAFVHRHKVDRLTKDVLKLAKRKGISKDALRRALGRKAS
jgi:hypothetical protein